MNHYVYRIDRPSTGEWYVGIRSCKCAPLEDFGYMGSGTRIRDLVRQYGRDHLTKTVLVQVQTRKEAQRIESELIGPDQVSDPQCLNLCVGGAYGSVGYRHTPEALVKIKEAARSQVFKPLTAAQRRRLSKAKTGKRRPPFSAETRAKMAAKRKAWWAKKKLEEK